MPDLDQILDTLITDVSARTRAPGASAAIKQAHRQRAKVAAAAVAAVAAVAFIAVGGGLAAGALDGSDRPSPIGEPTTPSPTTALESDEPRDLGDIVLDVPGWTLATEQVSVDDSAFTGTCAGDWGKSATGGGSAGGDFFRFPTATQASDAADRLVENLESCATTAWRTQPIAETGTVLATSAHAVVWIQQNGDKVDVLQLDTADGPPPLDVQVEVAEWVAAVSAE
jgi:hypothetical protein